MKLQDKVIIIIMSSSSSSQVVDVVVVSDLLVIRRNYLQLECETECRYEEECGCDGGGRGGGD